MTWRMNALLAIQMIYITRFYMHVEEIELFIKKLEKSNKLKDKIRIYQEKIEELRKETETICLTYHRYILRSEQINLVSEFEDYQKILDER